MNRIVVCLIPLTLVSAAPPGAPLLPLASDDQISAAERAPLSPFATANEWNAPHEPFKVIGNIHYVGSAGVSAWLITGKEGHILIDGILPQSVSLITDNIKTLGFDIRDVKYLLNSHAHIDHAGGLAGLKRASGAIMVASKADRPFLEAGDIGHGPTGGMTFPPVRVDRIIGDGQTIRLAGISMTAHLTPGHSPGCTSWSMKAKGNDGMTRQVFFHCSTTVAGQSLNPEAYPQMVKNFRTTFAKVRKMKADIFLANHHNFFGLKQKRARQIAGDENAFVDPTELARTNANMERAFETELKTAQLASKDITK